MGNEMGNGIVLFSNAAILFFIGDDETVWGFVLDERKCGI